MSPYREAAPAPAPAPQASSLPGSAWIAAAHAIGVLVGFAAGGYDSNAAPPPPAPDPCEQICASVGRVVAHSDIGFGPDTCDCGRGGRLATPCRWTSTSGFHEGCQ